MQTHDDFLIVGGGIVGLATAWQLMQRFPDAKIRLLEKESKVGQHQSGRNSGVLHSGIYYKPGSLKANTCREGRKAMVSFCEAEGIAHETCGKIIVATTDDEVPRLDAIRARGSENGIDCEPIDVQQMKELEPAVAGLAGIHVKQAGIVDYPGVCKRISELLHQQGHTVDLGHQVTRIERLPGEILVTTEKQKFSTRFLITCGGLYSDRLVRMSGLKPPAQIVPFRGEYYELLPEHRKLCRNLIYPVPDPNFPFLGVHFTRMTSGDVECGPNAVFALAREGYSWGKINPSDLWESLKYSGFRQLAFKHWRMGLSEVHRSLSKAAFVRALQQLIPSIQANHLKPCRSGVRAQALTQDGLMVDDFLWVIDERMVHVCNAPSPAATASLEIGRTIVDRVAETL